MTTSNHHYPPNSTLMSKTTHQQQQYIIPMHHTNIFHIPFFSLQQASVTEIPSLIHFLLVLQQISCLHNIARPLSNIPYNRKINLASLFFFCFFKYDSCSIWQNKNKYNIFEMLQLIFKKSANTFHQLLSSKFTSIFDFVPSITNQNNSIGITDHTRNVQLNKSRFLPKSLLLHEYCKTNHNNSKHTTNYSPPKYTYNTNLISNSLFFNEIENANKKKQPYNLLNTIKHQFNI